MCLSESVSAAVRGRKLHKTALGAAYLVVVAVCVAISVWTIFEGSKSLIGIPVAAGFACIIGIGLVAADMSIRDRRASGRSILPALGFLAICMVASGPSHFNFFYYSAVGERDAHDRLNEAQENFDVLLNDARAQLGEFDEVQRLRNRANELLEEYKTQVSLPEEQGHGPKAQAIFDKVLAEIQPTGIRPPRNRTMDGALTWLEGTLRPAVESKLDADAEGDALSQDLLDIKAKESEVGDGLRKLDAAGDIRSLTSDEARDMIETYKDAHTIVRETATNRLDAISKAPEFSAAEFSSDAKLVTPDMVVEDHIASSLTSGFVTRPYPAVTLFSLAASLLIDLIPTFFVLLLATGRDPEELHNHAPPAKKPKKRKSTDDYIEIN